MREPVIEIILPERIMDELSYRLVALTEAIHRKDPALVAHGLLGGEFGYGAHWDDDIFMMHPFCWCERDDCQWCGGCSCPSNAFHYFVDGKEVTYSEWSEFFDRETGGLKSPLVMTDHDRWLRLADAANMRRSEKHDGICDYCQGKGLFAAWPPGRGAPNFWHKSSGLMVWWYKYIGRGMEVVGREGYDVGYIIDACISRL